MSQGNDITRREAVARTALILGGTLAASSLSGVRGSAWARAAAPDWRAGTLDPDQSELVATIAEHIIPATDTPGARAAGVHRFVDVMLSNYYKEGERKQFLDGLAQLDARARKELTLLGYYTSEAGAMTELKVNPMGVYRGDIPYRSVGHSWA